MKKTISLLLALILIFTLAACSASDTSVEPKAEAEVPAASDVQEVEAEVTQETEEYVPFQMVNSGDTLAFTFETGDSFVLDYDESAMEVAGDDYNFVFYPKDYMLPMEIHCYTQDDHMLLEPYVEDMIAMGDWIYELETFPVVCSRIGDIELQSVTNGYDENLFLIPMGHHNAIFGFIHFTDGEGHPEFDPLTVWNMILKSGPASAKVTYAYEEPIFLGDDPSSMTYSIDGNIYRFPTPAQELIKDGWEIPEYFKMGTPQIAVGDTVEAAFKMNDKTIWNVLLRNPTEEPIPIDQGLVVSMLIAQNSAVDLVLPDAISLYSTEDAVAASTSNAVHNGNYTTYTWVGSNHETISAWCHPDQRTVEYFEFWE